MAKQNPFAGDAPDPFAKAREKFGRASATFDKVTDYEGELLLVTPSKYDEGLETSFGEANAITADVVVLTGDEAPKELDGVMIFQKVLIGQLRGRIGKDPVLGVLSKRKSQKAGRSDAWFLDSDSVTEEHVDLALAYVEAKEKARGEAMKADAPA